MTATEKQPFNTLERIEAHNAPHECLFNRDNEPSTYMVPVGDYNIMRDALGFLIGANCLLPVNEFQARMMQALGYNYLKEHKPEQLRVNLDRKIIEKAFHQFTQAYVLLEHLAREPSTVNAEKNEPNMKRWKETLDELAARLEPNDFQLEKD